MKGMSLLRTLTCLVVFAALVVGASPTAHGSYTYYGIRWYGPRYYPYYGPYVAGWYPPWYATPYRFGYGVYHHAYGLYPWYYAPYSRPYSTNYGPAPGPLVETPAVVAPDDEAGCYYW
jgi:hypothetical protein